MWTLSSDACPVRMLSEEEYGVHTLSEEQILLLFAFCMCLCCGSVHWHLLCRGWGETFGCPTLCVVWFVSARILPIVAKISILFMSCARCTRAVHTRPHNPRAYEQFHQPFYKRPRFAQITPLHISLPKIIPPTTHE